MSKGRKERTHPLQISDRGGVAMQMTSPSGAINVWDIALKANIQGGPGKLTADYEQLQYK